MTTGRSTHANRRAAKRPAARTVRVEIADGDFAGWAATARADFAARVLADLQSGDVERVINALEAIITEHNFPNEQDEVATTLGDVTPYDGLLAVGSRIFEEIGRIPNR